MVALVEPSSEDEMIATFISAELDSPRPRRVARIRDAMQTFGLTDEMIIRPDTASASENGARRDVFVAYRGWGLDEGLFEGLPDEIEWWWGELTKEDLCTRTFTIEWYFVANHGTRSPSELAAASFGSEPPPENRVPERVKQGDVLEPAILIAEPDLQRLVILEGHNRLIGYARVLEHVRFPLRVLIGVSAGASEWSEW